MGADYSKLIDDEIRAFIDKTIALYPEDAVDATIERQREIYDRMARAFHAGYPPGISAEDDTIEAGDIAVPIRRYRCDARNENATILYYHGGGFVVGGLESHDDVCAEICAATGYDTVSVDYRLAPEHPHPAAFDDCLAAFRSTARTRAHPIVLVGDSAGGNLAAAVCHATRSDAVRPAGQMLIYPGLGGDHERGSYIEHAHAPLLTRADLEFYRDVRTGGAEIGADPTYAPLHDRTFADLPPTVIASAQCDPLCDDGRDYRDRILAEGGRAVWFEDAGLVHGHLRARHMSARAAASFDRILANVRMLAERRWDYVP